MKCFGRTSLSEILQDRVVYRNLAPADSRLPTLEQLRDALGFPANYIPRKNQPEYAAALAPILEHARKLDAPNAIVKRLICIGDTRMNDGAAFTNLCRAGGWKGLAFIASETKDTENLDVIEQEHGILILTNRWGAMSAFESFRREQKFPIDEQTIIIMDLDKTLLGARGRNDHVIDAARVAAVRRTVGDLLGDQFDPEGFQAAYDRLNQPEFHPFTTDNQDYLAYICLIVGSGLLDITSLVDALRSGSLSSFERWINVVDQRAAELPAHLQKIHNKVVALVRQGDPTPFKDFRRQEYQTTIEHMGRLEDHAPVSAMLQGEIVITQEVREIALAWRDQGALLFGVSDKPDEASIPSDALAAQGYQAIHKVETHAVGGE